MLQILSDSLIVCGVGLIAIGMYGMLRYRHLSVRILIAAKVDTVGFFTVMLGAMLHTGLSYHSGKILLILVLTLVTNPLINHSIAHSAHVSGYRLKGEDHKRG